MNTATQLLGQAEQEPCVHEKSPEACYRVRCQLGKKCIDDDLSFRHTTQPPKQVEQEPIGTVRQANGCTYVEWNHVPPEAGTVCYAAPQAREPMSEDEIIKIRKAVGDDISKPFGSSIAFAHAIESHHGIK